MAKVLISSIGVGDREKGYQKANYKIDNTVYEQEAFIANVLVHHEDIDKLFLIGTRDSIWELVCEKFGGSQDDAFKIMESKDNKTLNEEDLTIVSNVIDSSLNHEGSRCFVIDYGINEEELWGNFEKFLIILDLIQEGDEVYLDITHSFRSLSMMSFIMSEFGQTQKRFEIGGVFYGMFEYASQNNGITPVIDLKMFFDLLKWAKALKNLKDYGNAKDLALLIHSVADEKEVVNSFDDFNCALTISDIGAIQGSIKRLKGKLSFFEEHASPIVRIVSNELKKFIQKFSTESVAKLQLDLARWYADNNNYPMAYMSLVEGILSHVCEKRGENLESKDARDEIKYELSGLKKNAFEREFSTTFKNINTIRNGIAHKTAPGEKSRPSAKDSVNNFDSYYAILVQGLKNI
jgi:CRISPR-associated Csx2 family protein